MKVSALLQHFEIPVVAASGTALAAYSPGDGSLLAHVAVTPSADYEPMVQRALEAAALWAQVPAPRRGELVRLLGEELRLHKRELAELVARENGKILAEALGEVQEMIDIADFAVGQSRMLYGRTMHSERPQHRMYEQWHPLGVVGIISAFNFPVAVWSWNALLAAICGNACIWKPSPKTPLSALAVQALCSRVLARNHAPAIFQLLLDGGTEHATRLVADRRVPLISFTGSTHVGRKVGEVVAARLGKSLLELGGNNAIIVDETADLAMASRAIAFGALGTAGQRCTTTRRVFVHRSRLAELQRSLVSAYKQARIGDPLDAATLVGPLIDAAAVAAFAAAVSAATAAGGELLVGGKVLSGPGHYVEPAIFVARNDWQIVQRETFGPILYLIPVDSLEEAIRLQNAVRLRPVLGALHPAAGACGAIPRRRRQRLRHRQYQHRHLGCGDRWRVRRREGHGRRSRSRLAISWKSYMRRQTTTINWGQTLPLAQGIEFDLT